MSEHAWTCVEGMMIGTECDPHAVATQLAERGILAQLEWFDSTPQLLGLNIALADGRIACLKAGEDAATPGPTPAELAEELAVLFDAEVRIGHERYDSLPDGESPLADVLPSEADLVFDDELPVRLAEIGRTPASSVPLLAALEGVDIADIDLDDNYRALLAEISDDKAGWNFGDLPLVTLSMHDGDLHLFLVTDDHLENVVAHNWGMTVLLVPGGYDSVEDAPSDIIDLVGDRPDLEEIASYLPQADTQALVDAQSAHGDAAVYAVVNALGLPQSVAHFLLGRSSLDEVEGATLHYARGISNAIGRSVDIMLATQERREIKIVTLYRKTLAERPWVIFGAAALESVAGAALLRHCLKTPSPRSGGRIAAGITGGLLLADGCAQALIAGIVRRQLSDEQSA